MKASEKRIPWLFEKTRKGSPAGRFATYLVLIFACLVAVYPILRVVSVSLRPGDRLLSTDLAIIPPDATLENYRAVMMDTRFPVWLWNSLIITISTAFIGVMIASTSAYAFSRWNFKGKKAGLIFLFATQMIPAAMLMIPLYILAARLGLINTWRGLVIAYSVSSVPFSIWVLKGYYDTIPYELEEAAMIDGASRMAAFRRIILPLSTPSLAIAFLFNFTSAWNDYLLARIMLQREEMFIWTQGLRTFADNFRTQWGYYSAASLIVAVPVMILFLASSKFLLSGLTVGSVKG
ncbi:MAG: sugar ABC transporter permease [Spirochaetaceae bacterium]|nr:sugar ABC transporter permease [Spirochaetaceae bacterium]